LRRTLQVSVILVGEKCPTEFLQYNGASPLLLHSGIKAGKKINTNYIQVLAFPERMAHN
jgi:hypothetical protein